LIAHQPLHEGQPARHLRVAIPLPLDETDTTNRRGRSGGRPGAIADPTRPVAHHPLTTDAMRGHTSKPVVTDHWQRQEAAAWELLYAVCELFPEKFAELERIGDDLHDERRRMAFAEDEAGNDFDAPGTLPEKFQKCVREWTEKIGISCDAVNVAATRYTAGEDGPLDGRLTKAFHANGDPVDTTPAIHANPFDETIDEFVARAKRHYNDVCALHRKNGRYKKGPFKREHDHFRYLAARLVGRREWREIARDHSQLGVTTRRSSKTVAGEASKIADLLKISLPPGTPGRPRNRSRQ
jgi:hypothetical protein